MRVLITNHALAAVGGTQAYVRDLAFWLLEQGHTPIVYAPSHGETARQLMRRTVAVTDNLRSVAQTPDIIHGNSGKTTAIAALHFPTTPAIFTCHNWLGESATPPSLPRIFQYVAVDDTCADRLVLREGIAPERVTVLLNAVDLTRFSQRAMLPQYPRRALVFSNGAHELSYLPAVREACKAAKLELDVVGRSSGTSVEDPEKLLGKYDLVFAKGKCALEAMAIGAAVILCDAAGLGGMVRSSEVPRLQRLNFGMRTLRHAITPAAVEREIKSYDAEDARAVSNMIRNTAAATDMHARLFDLFVEVMERSAQSGLPDWHAESRATAEWLQRSATQNTAAGPSLTPMLQASHRILTAPIIGPMLSRTARWMLGAARR